MTNIVAKVQAGVDWWLLFGYADATGTPIALTDFKMEMRAGKNSTTALIFTSEGVTPDFVVTQPAAHQFLASLPSATSADHVEQSGWWDAYAVDPDGHRLQLGAGEVKITSNVTEL